MGARSTHSEYVIIIAFPRQQWLRECASVLRLYVHYLSVTYFLHSNIWTAWTIFYPSPYVYKTIIIRSQRFQTARRFNRQVVFDLLSEKGMCHVTVIYLLFLRLLVRNVEKKMVSEVYP
jgi:hypothetical protein